jgi:DNA-binding NarL/FixJ family response regulator
MLDSAFEPVHAAPATLEERLGPALNHRPLAVIADQQSASELALSELWAQLACGGLEITDDFVTKQRCYLIVREREAGMLTASRARGVALLKHVFMAGCQKVATFELGMAPSSATELGRNTLLAMGLRCRVQDTPFILVAAANAQSSGQAGARRSALRQGLLSLQVLSVARPDESLARLLTPAVLEVTSAMIEGHTRTQIARLRARSQRTVANQLACAFKQLNAFSRLDLLRILAGPGSRVAESGRVELKTPAPAPDLNARLCHVSSHGAHVAAMLP